MIILFKKMKYDFLMIKLFFVLVFILSSTLVMAEEITIGAENDAAPWSYPNGTGYVNDIVKAAYKAVGWKVHYEVFPYARCKTLVLSGGILGCFSTSKTPELTGKLFFPRTPVIAPRNILYAQKNSDINGCNPKKWKAGTSIGLVNEYEYVPKVEALRNEKNLSIEKSPSEVLNLRKLNFSHTDTALITIDEVHSLEYIAKLARVTPDFKVVCDFGNLPAYLVLSKSHPLGKKALEVFNQGMEKIAANGVLKKIQKEWKVKAIATAVPQISEGK